MSQKSFINTERQIGEWWRAKLHKSMVEAGCEERKLAIERKDFHEGVPATMHCDCRCRMVKKIPSTFIQCKIRSGGHYWLLHTETTPHWCAKQILCSMCKRNWRPHMLPKLEWELFSNETDIIMDGFCQAERVHGLRYMRFIGDGDSWVYPTLLTTVPGWGRAIVKMECTNHTCKCYRAVTP